MTEWFGIGLLLAFSVSVSLFSQLHSGRWRGRELPAGMGQWRVDPPTPDGHAREQRLVLQDAPWPRRKRLVEQTRIRKLSTGKLIGPANERVVARFWF